MAIALDASSPGYFQCNSSAASGGTNSGTSASFTPPDNSLVVIHQTVNSGTNATPTFATPTNTGTALTWTSTVTKAPGGTTNAMAVAIWTAYNTHQAGSITVTVSATSTGATGSTSNDNQSSVQVWTGAASSQSGAATASGTSSTASISPSITSTVTGSRCVGNFGDWAGGETPTSSDSGSGWQSTTNSDGIVAYKAANNGAPGTVTINAASTSPRWTYALAEILPASGNVTVALTGQGATFAAGSAAPSSSVALTGQSATFAAGTLVPGLSLALLGQRGTFTSGLLTPNLSVPLTGQAATFTAGTLIASSGGDVTLSLIGQAATLSAGTLSPATTTALNGQPLTSSPGTLLPSSTLALTGISATFSAGTVASASSVPLVGQSAVFTPGQLGIGGDVTVALTGAQATFTAGTIAVLPASGDTHDPLPKRRRRFDDSAQTQVIRESQLKPKAKRAKAPVALPERVPPALTDSPEDEEMLAKLIAADDAAVTTAIEGALDLLRTLQ